MQNSRRSVATIGGHTFVPRFIGSRSTIVDLGGNLGEFSQALVKRFGCTCYVVEPVPALFAQIPTSARLHSFNLAITDRSRPLQFFTADDITAGSLTPRGATNATPITVQGVALEEFLADHDIRRVDLLKVDIEGAERELFASLNEAVLKRIRQITIEFHDFVPEIMSLDDVNRIRERLEIAGFRCLSWKLRSNMDVLFVRRELMSVQEYLWVKYVVRPASKLAPRLKRLLRRATIPA